MSSKDGGSELDRRAGPPAQAAGLVKEEAGAKEPTVPAAQPEGETLDGDDAPTMGLRARKVRGNGAKRRLAVDTSAPLAEESLQAPVAETPSTPYHPLPEAPWRTKVMVVSYSLILLVGFTLSLLSDLSRVVPALLKCSLGLQIASSLFFLLVVPLTHLSGIFYHSKWRFYMPFRGGVRFITFQALAWSFYALCLVLAMGGLIFWSFLAKAAFGIFTSFGAIGVLSQVFMVTSLFVYERQKRGGPRQRTGSGVARNTIATAKRVAGLVGGVSRSIYREMFYHHNMVLGVVAVALAMLAEYCWLNTEMPKRQMFARGAGALSVLLFTTVVFNTYGIGGSLTNRRKWRFWQPFIGGAKFIVLQALSWTFFTVSVVVEILFVISTFALGFEFFVGAAVVAGAFFLASEVLMIVSLSFYMPTGKVEGLTKKISFKPVKVNEESMEQFRRLTVITVLANMQYLPFLLPIGPFLACGLSLSEAGPHWFGFFCCLASTVVVSAYVKVMIAKASDAANGGRRSRVQAVVSWLLPGMIYSLPAFCSLASYSTRAFPAWVLMTACYYVYVALTFPGNPAVTGSRYLGDNLELYGMSLYGLLDGIDKYFHGKLISAGGLEKDKCYVYGFHPHGVQPFTVFWIQLSKAWREDFRGMRFNVLTASVMHYVPLMRDITQWLGGREVSKEAVVNSLSHGESILLVPGGQQEMMESQSKTDEVRVVTKHVGFIRVAMHHGVPLVPVMSYGETEVMDFVRIPGMQRFFISRIGIPVPFFPYGLLGFPIPRPVPVTVVFGKPMPVKKVENPTREEIQEVAKQYFAALQQLFDEYKGQATGCEHHRLVLM